MTLPAYMPATVPQCGVSIFNVALRHMMWLPASGESCPLFVRCHFSLRVWQGGDNPPVRLTEGSGSHPTSGYASQSIVELLAEFATGIWLVPQTADACTAQLFATVWHGCLSGYPVCRGQHMLTQSLATSAQQPIWVYPWGRGTSPPPPSKKRLVVLDMTCNQAEL